MTTVHIQADADLGVPSRVLDLIAAQEHLPTRFSLTREGARMSVSLDLDGIAPARIARLTAKFRQIPGVRSAAYSEAAMPL